MASLRPEHFDAYVVGAAGRDRVHGHLEHGRAPVAGQNREVFARLDHEVEADIEVSDRKIRIYIQFCYCIRLCKISENASM